MTKSELIDRLAERRGLPRKTAEQVVNVIFGAMKESLVDGGRIEIRGFGSFKVRHYKGYVGRNPMTGQPQEVAPKRMPVFKVSKNLKAQLNDDLQ
ncbi:MAG: integration host factor subunit beta [Alphaproteobacteria bacterium]|nr:integration host factor subunit beta [Alphaproteobacteria bacterium]